MSSKSRTRRFGLVVVLLLLAFALSACPAQPVAPGEAPSEAAPPSLVTITFVQEPDNLSPLYTTMWFSGILTDFWLLGLWNFNDNLEPTPQLAREIPTAANGGISEDGRTITIHLREDARWSDGAPVTAADFVFTYEMIMDERNAVISRHPYDQFVAGVEADGDHTLVVTFHEPYAPWLSSIFTYVLPKHILEPVMEANGTLDGADWNRNPTVGVGPYVFKEWESGSHLLFERNPNHWQQPNIDRIFIRITPDDAAQVAAIKAGDTDIGVFISFSDVPELEALGTVNVVSTPSGFMEGWFFNFGEQAHPAIRDRNVRWALAHGFDRWQITQDLLLGLSEPPASPWDLSPYASPNIQPVPYDPERAAQLLDEAGWVMGADGVREKDGEKLILRYVTNMRRLRLDTQVVVQDMFRDLGVRFELINHPSDIFFASYAEGGAIATGQYDIAEWSSQPEAYPDPDTSRWTCREIPTPDNPAGSNWNFYCNPELDELFARQAVTVDMQARIAIFEEIERIIQEDMVWLGVWQDNDIWTVSKRLSNVRLSGADPFWNAANWTLE
ncbi:ABC transporter substrate-binding protein [Caldilinea sp.]|jgi:peptide/nickel transport system substrate-binding protein|uniref:ABC transporter substrate-binding protein n=1 Tax=Caldilinea sp. TaxID=2293560 RepID=UPI0026275AF6|nr:peptide ABC transporter substrate-binding protein [uncultured Caldilinea sp.]